MAMVVVVFEFEPDPAMTDRYFDLAGALRFEVEKIDGFISVERFESVSQNGRFVSISTWRDLAAVKAWREYAEHQAAQNESKERGMFRNYRIRVADVVRDYGL